jgi:hypothetical protein
MFRRIRWGEGVISRIRGEGKVEVGEKPSQVTFCWTILFVLEIFNRKGRILQKWKANIFVVDQSSCFDKILLH